MYFVLRLSTPFGARRSAVSLISSISFSISNLGFINLMLSVFLAVIVWGCKYQRLGNVNTGCNPGSFHVQSYQQVGCIVRFTRLLGD